MDSRHRVGLTWAFFGVLLGVRRVRWPAREQMQQLRALRSRRTVVVAPEE